MEQTAPLQDLTALVRPELVRLNAELARDLAPGEADLQPLLDHVAHYRGKQLRSALVFLAGKAVGDTSDAHVTVAKVIELIHTASLVHDDILDHATLRRQLATVHSLHGSEVSVLLGDYLYARAFNLAVSIDDVTCARVLSEVTRVICQGEITQLLHRFDFDWTEERYVRVIRDKTASLFAAATRLGAHYSGGSATTCAALERFGLELGIAFQIADDCLDLRGDEGVVGKSLGTDLDAGKLTLPLLHMMHARADGPIVLHEIMSGPNALLRLQREFDVAAAVEFSEERARRRIEDGLEALRELPASPAREAMEALAMFMVRRER